MGKQVKSSKRAVKGQRISRANHSLNPDREKSGKKGEKKGNMRDKATVKRLLMYKGGRPVRNNRGQIVREAQFQESLPSGTMARVEPNRRWFGNTRVIAQSELQKFHENIDKVKRDPFQVVLRATKLPITLLEQKAKQARVHLLDTQTFESTFGPRCTRKRPKLRVSDMQEFVSEIETKDKQFDDTNEIPEPSSTLKNDGVALEESSQPAGGETKTQTQTAAEGESLETMFERELIAESRRESSELVFRAGKSRRVYNELFKVIDSSDVVIQVLDARDPLGTRSRYVEDYIRKEKSHKHVVLLLNKIDLVPTAVTKKWLEVLSKEYPTIAFHASLTHAFGKSALINTLRQFAKLHADARQISVGLLGYPNVGKSSVINTLRGIKVCNVAPIPGETKVWQYVTLMKRIYLIDSPGVVRPTRTADETECVLKGVVRVEHLKCPEVYIPAVLNHVRPQYLVRAYRLPATASWRTPTEFLELLARKSGRLLKNSEPDMSTTAKMVLMDFQRGKLPYYVAPPGWTSDADEHRRKDSKRFEELAELNARAAKSHKLKKSTASTSKAAGENTGDNDDDDMASNVDDEDQEQLNTDLQADSESESESNVEPSETNKIDCTE